MNHLVARFHEIGLKGGNRALFERQLVETIRAQIADFSVGAITRDDGRVVCTFKEEISEALLKRFQQIFGIASVSPVVRVEATETAISEMAVALVRERAPATFVVRTKRADKRFPRTSAELNREVGAVICETLGTRVDLINPACTVQIEITSRGAFLSVEKYQGACGLPVGSSGRVLAMLSGGIDSPVAAWKVMKRGCNVTFAHFHSYPHTSRASITKVEELARIVGAYQPHSRLYLIPFGDIQREVVMKCTPRYRVLLYRRLMARVGMALAAREHALALVTGESIGQVASQTIRNLAAVESAIELPIFRPLIGEDKEEIITVAKRIGTFDVSIEPHDDCCTLFNPKFPATGASSADLDREESLLDVPALIESTLKEVELKTW